MLLFVILAVMAVVLLFTVITSVAVGGAGFILVFGDVIVCIAIIVGICVAIVRSKRGA